MPADQTPAQSRCGSSMSGHGPCARRAAHVGHCAKGGSYAMALDERDDAREALRALWEDMHAIDRHHVPAALVAKVKAVLRDV